MRRIIRIYTLAAARFYDDALGISSFDVNSDDDAPTAIERALARKLTPFLYSGVVRWHVGAAAFVFAGPVWQRLAVVREAYAVRYEGRVDKPNAPGSAAANASRVRNSVPTLGALLVGLLVHSTVAGYELPAWMYCAYGNRVVAELREGRDVAGECEAKRAASARGLAAVFTRMREGTETRPLTLDWRSQFGSFEARDGEYLAAPIVIGVIPPAVFGAWRSVLGDDSPCPALRDFLVAADDIAIGPFGGRDLEPILRNLLSGDPGRTSVLFAGDLAWRLGDEPWTEKWEPWPSH